MTDNHWIKVDQELAKLIVLATLLPPIEPDFDFNISCKNVWDNGNPTGICRLMQE